MKQNKYTYLDFAREVLKTAHEPLTFQEIWKAGSEMYLTPKLKVAGRTPWQTLGARLFVDVRDNSNTSFMKVGRHPTRFFLVSRKNEISSIMPINNDESSTVKAIGKVKNGFSERDIHPLLAYFAFTNTSFNREKQIYTKTIHHEKVAHKTLSEWVFPDMVGFYSPIDDWNPKLMDFSKVVGRKSVRLYSFEIKKQIHRSNYRECFFQAVSNSSWANEGYLVTCSIQESDDVRAELKRLSEAFGIGIIILNLNDIDDESSVFSPARWNEELDWEMMNKLCEQSKEFATFVDDVQRDHEGGKIHPSDYDLVRDDIEKYVQHLESRKY